MLKTPEQLRAKAAECLARAERHSNTSWHAADNAPGSYITGGSGRSRAQNRATDRALDSTIKHAKLACYWREKAASLEIQARYIENAPAREATKARRDAADKAARRKEIALPIINDPAADKHMTAAEWAKEHRDYKSIISAGTYRYRSLMYSVPGQGHTLGPVYLTDKPTKEKPQ